MYYGVGMFLQDGPMYPEADRVLDDRRQVGGASRVAPPAGRTTPVVLTVHCGSRANRVTFSTHGWQQTLDLVPGIAKASPCRCRPPA